MPSKVPPKGGIQFNVHIDQRDVDRVTRRLDKMHGAPLQKAIQKAQVGGAALLVSPLRGAAPVSPRGQKGKYPHASGNLRRKIAARSVKKRPGEVGAAYAGTRVWYGLWVQDGTSRGVSPNPFVRNVTKTLEPAIRNYIDEQVRRMTD